MRLAVASLLALAAWASTSAASGTAPAASFTWPVPAGWRKETIPFPLSFAPALPYRGTEELRFAPRFFDPKSPTYFTYSFAFVLDGKPAMTPEILGRDMKTYFNGLASAVTKAPSDPSLHSASFTSAANGHYVGRVHTIDAFGDKRALDLRAEVDTFTCGDRRIVLASLSPLGADAPIWKELASVRHSFECADGNKS